MTLAIDVDQVVAHAHLGECEIQQPEYQNKRRNGAVRNSDRKYEKISRHHIGEVQLGRAAKNALFVVTVRI